MGDKVILMRDKGGGKFERNDGESDIKRSESSFGKNPHGGETDVVQRGSKYSNKKPPGPSKDRRDGYSSSQRFSGNGEKCDEKNSGYRAVNSRNPKQRRDRERERNFPARGKPPRRGFKSQEYTASEFKKDPTGKHHILDSELSRLVAQIYREDGRVFKLATVKHLLEFLNDPSNELVIRKTGEALWEAISDYFTTDRLSKDVKVLAAEALARSGNVSVANDNGLRFLEWVAAKMELVNTTIKGYYLHTLNTVISSSETHTDATIKPFMDNVLTLLESVDTPDLFRRTSQLVLALAQRYPESFSPKFCDIVDILIGWHMESQSSTITQITSHSLVAMRKFWLADGTFGKTLLSQFLDDMRAYQNDMEEALGGTIEGADEQKEADSKRKLLETLMSIFPSVVEAMGQDTSAAGKVVGPNGPIFSTDEVCQILNRLVACSKGVYASHPSPTLLLLSNSCISSILTHLVGGAGLGHTHPALSEFILYQLSLKEVVRGYQFIVSLSNCAAKIIESSKNQVDHAFVTSLLSSCLCGSVHSPSSVLVATKGLLCTLLRVKNVKVLQTTYRYLLEGVESAVSVLTGAAESGVCCGEQPLSGSAKSEGGYFNLLSGREAETVILFITDVLTDIATDVSNLMGVYSLSPSIFTLLRGTLVVEGNRALRRHTVSYHSLLTLFYSHCSRHKFFISGSSQVKSRYGMEDGDITSQTGEYFLLIIAFLKELLCYEKLGISTRCLIIKWTAELVMTAIEKWEPLVKLEQLRTLVMAFSQRDGQSSESDILLSYCDFYSTLLPVVTLLPEMFPEKAFNFCTLHIGGRSSAVSKRCLDTLVKVPLATVCSRQQNTGTSDSSVKSHSKVRRAMMSKVSVMFSAENFRTTMSYILKGTSPGEDLALWLESIFRVSYKTSSTNDPFVPDLSQLWFWAVWQSASHCVQNRLRTPIGKPQETFTALESTLKRLAAQTRDTSTLSYVFDAGELERVRLLLSFMECLEKLIYNAYEGCVNTIPSASRAVRTFFCANRGTCMDWLTRLRLTLMRVASASCQYAAVVRHGSELLLDMQKNHNTKVSEFDHAVAFMVEALTALSCPEEILGLYRWCKSACSKRLYWIKPNVDLALGRYKMAANGFKNVLVRLETENFDVTIPPPAATNKPTHEDKPEETTSAVKLLNKPPTQDITPSVKVLTKPDTPVKLLVKPEPESTGPPVVKLLSKPDFTVVEHCLSRLALCHVTLHDWDELTDTLKEADTHLGTTNNGPGGSSILLPYQNDGNLINALTCYERGDYSEAFAALSRSGSANEQAAREATPLETFTWNVKATLQSNTKQICRSTVHYVAKANLAALGRSLEKTHTVTTDLLSDECKAWPRSINTGLFTQLLMEKTLLGEMPLKGYWSCSEMISCPDVNVLLDCAFALKAKAATCTLNADKYSQQLNAIQLVAAKIARKHGNLDLSSHILRDVFTSAGIEARHSPFSFDGDSRGDASLASLVCGRVGGGSARGLSALAVDREACKVMYARDDSSRDAVQALSHSVTSFLLASEKFVVGEKDQQQCTEAAIRSLLTLTKWLQNDQKMLLSVANLVHGKPKLDNADVIGRNIKMILNTKRLGSYINPVLSEEERVVGSLLQLSASLAPTLSKAWFQLGGWCYKWGRKAIEVASQGDLQLTTHERETLLEMLPPELDENEVAGVLAVIGRLHAQGQQNEEDISDQGQYDEGTVTLTKLLRQVSLRLPEELVGRLVEIWKIVVRRVYHLYMESADSYFKYLKFDHGVEADNTTATLRLLRLLVKHAWELREVLENGLAITSTAPWKAIIPQLFSRLTHPEAYVRGSVSDLLGRLSSDAPHLIVYPAVVGSLTSSNSTATSRTLVGTSLGISSDPDVTSISRVDTGSCNSELDDDSALTAVNPGSSVGGGPSGGGSGEGENGGSVTSASRSGTPTTDRGEEDGVRDTAAVNLRNCFSGLVRKLAEKNPVMISEVKLLTEELTRLTALWDELWLGTLAQLAPLIQDKLAQLTLEVSKVKANESLSKTERTLIARSKHRAVLAQPIHTLERLTDITTSNSPITSHERWFQSTYGEVLKNALDKLKNPSRPEDPAYSWYSFKMFHQSLQQRAQKKSSLSLRLEDVSERLAAFRGTSVAMPGLVPSGALTSSSPSGSASGDVVTIVSLSSAVTILPTKTKPKKLLLLGSDGRKYTYLFKGLEDLHLDERIMQFLAIVNSMLAKGKEPDRPLLKARHYSVTPLGVHSGLIQWVDGSSPLFAIYKRWQMRTAAAAAAAATTQQSTAGRSTTASSAQTSGSAAGQAATAAVAPTLQRPSEMFYSKLMPRLKPLFDGRSTREIERARSEWPKGALVATLKELIDETPTDIVAKEMWCSSSSAREWFDVTQMYSRSLAVMSMIGYIIGLGDRHLDNLMLDTSTGEIVHIDYNVCFDKGRSLRVPETVPFRLTPNLQRALGVSSGGVGGVTVEGTFRSSCEQTIKTMRRGRETLLTLLEAFVYDPLVDWTVGGETGLAGATALHQQGAGSAVGGGGTGQGGSALEHKARKKDLERETARTMFAVRVLEIRTDWMKNKEGFGDALSSLREESETILGYRAELSELEEQRTSHQDLSQAVSSAASNRADALNGFPERYARFSQLQENLVLVRQNLDEAINENEKWHTHHKTLGEKLAQPHTLQRIIDAILVPPILDTTVYQSVDEFLLAAGQASVIPQCSALVKDLEAILIRRRALMHTCVESIFKYSAVTGQLPLTYFEDSRSSQHLIWLKQIVTDFTSARCRSVFSDGKQRYGSPSAATGGLMVSNLIRLGEILGTLQDKHRRIQERAALEHTPGERLTVLLSDSKMAIEGFSTSGSMNRSSAVFCSCVSHLMTLAKKVLVLEGAAHSAGDQLAALTSREGDWFLDDLVSLTANIVDVLSIAKTSSQTVVAVGESPLDSDTEARLWQLIPKVARVFAALDKVYTDFRVAILPETLKHMQRGDVSVADVLGRLRRAGVMDTVHLRGLQKQAESALISVLFGGNENEADECRQLVEGVRVLYNGEVASARGANPPMAPGQLLLIAFDSLFETLGEEWKKVAAELVAGFPSIPAQWKKLDVVKEAISMQMTVYKETTLPLVTDILFIRKLIVISEFFSLCESHVAGLQGRPASSMVLDDEILSGPFKGFVAYFVRRHVLGLTSQSIGYLLSSSLARLGLNVQAEVALRDIGASFKVSSEELCRKAVDVYLRSGHTHISTLGQASNLLNDFEAKLRRQSISLRLAKGMSLNAASAVRRQQELVSFQWVHEETLISSGGGKPLPLPASLPTAILTEITRSLQILASLESAHCEVIEKLTAAEVGISHRLKWAAGANPSLSATLRGFEAMQHKRLEMVKTEGALLQHVGMIGNHLLHFEAMRKNTKEAAAADERFRALVDSCFATCVEAEVCQSELSPQEMTLISMMSLSDVQASNWLDLALAQVQSLDLDIKRKENETRKAVKSHIDASGKVASKIQNVILAAHHRLISEVRSVLKSLAKQEEAKQSGGESVGPVSAFMRRYRIFSDNISSLIQMCTAAVAAAESSPVEGEGDSEKDAWPAEEIIAASETVRLELDSIYISLLMLSKPLEETGEDDEKLTNTAAEGTKKVAGGEKVLRDPVTGKVIQEKNSYAVSVWRKVKMKLDGRETEIGRRLNVQEQVSSLIEESMDMTRLSHMYEGWTAWV